MSCDYDFDSSKGFCSEVCRKKSDGYVGLKVRVLGLCVSLNGVQKSNLIDVIRSVDDIIREEELISWINESNSPNKK